MTQPPDYRYVSILWATPEQAAECARLHAALFDEPWDAPSFARLLGEPRSTAFVARVGEQPETVGFVVGQIAADEAEILTLGVGADHQRHGIGLRLVQALARAARKAEVRRLHLEVSDANVTALALYKKLGFEETGRRTGYYRKPGAPPVDAITLALTL